MSLSSHEAPVQVYLLRFGVPALRHEPVQAPELDLLWSSQHRSKAFGELLGYLQLVLSQCGSPAGQQLKEHHAVREHVHLEDRKGKKGVGFM